MKSTQKWLWYGLMKIWFILGHSKVHNFFLAKIFFNNFFAHIFFSFNISYIKSLYNIINEIHTNKMHVYKGTNNKPIHIFQHQKSIFWYISCKFFYKCLFFQVNNLNLITSLKNYCFYGMLITWKCAPLCKILECNPKSESPYFAIILFNLGVGWIVGFNLGVCWMAMNYQECAAKQRPKM